MSKPVAKQAVVIIIGSNGFIGKAAVQRFAVPYRVIGLDTDSSIQVPEGTKYLPIDLSSDGNVKSVFDQIRNEEGEDLTSVIHLTSYEHFTDSPNPKYDAITVWGVGRILRELKRFHVDQFLFASTILVHSPCKPGQIIRENSSLGPRWSYPISKLNAEILILETHGNIPVVLMRLGNIYDDFCHSVPLSHQIHHIYEKMPISHFFPGDREHGQVFVHLDDVIEALWLAVQNRKRLPNEFPLLIGEPETLSYGQIQYTLGLLLHGKEWTTAWIPKHLAEFIAKVRNHLPFREEPLLKTDLIPFIDDHYAIALNRARSSLGWEPTHRLIDDLRKMVEILKIDPLRWYKENKIEPPNGLKQKEAA